MKKIILISVSVLMAFASWAQGTKTVTTLSLQQCLDMAAANDPYVKNAHLDILAAQAQKAEALAMYFPTIEMRSLGFHALQPLVKVGMSDILGYSDAANNIKMLIDQTAPLYGISTTYKTMQYGYMSGVMFTQPVFAGGRIVNGNRLAGIGIEAAKVQSQLRNKATATEVEEKYWRVVSLDEKSVTLTHAKELLDTLYKDAVSAHNAGLLTDAEMLQVKLKKSELRSKEVQLKGGIQLAKMDLFNAIGLEYSVLGLDGIFFADRIDTLSSPEAYYVPAEELAAKAEESKLLSLQVKAKDIEKKMAMGEALPEVGVGGMYGYGKLISKNGAFNGLLFATVKIPITDWGKTSMKMKRLDYQTQKARNEQEYLDAQLVLRARQRWVALNTAWEQYSVQKEAVAIASEDVAKMQSGFHAGMVPLSDLLKSQTELRSAQDSLIDCAIAYRKALSEYQGKADFSAE